MLTEEIIKLIAKTLVEIFIGLLVTYFFILWALENLAIDSGLTVYVHQTFSNACYICAAVWGLKVIK